MADDLHIHITLNTPPDPRIDRMVTLLERLNTQEHHIMAALDDLEANVAAEEGAIASTVTLLTTIHDELVAAIAANDQPRIQAVADKLAADTTTLSEAVAANPDPNAVVPPPAP